MPVDGIPSAGCTIHMSTEVGSPQNFVAIGNVVDFTGPNGTRTVIPVGNLSTDTTPKISGHLDNGDFSFTINLDPANSSHDALRAALEDGDAREFKLTLSDSNTEEYHFNGIVQSLSLSGPYNDKVTASVGVAISGAIWIV